MTRPAESSSAGAVGSWADGSPRGSGEEVGTRSGAARAANAPFAIRWVQHAGGWSRASYRPTDPAASRRPV